MVKESKKELEELKERCRQAEKELHHSRDLFVKSEKLSQSGSWELNLDKYEFEISESLKQISGLNSTHISWENFKSIVPSEDWPQIQSILQKALAGKALFDVHHRIIRQSDGECRYVHSRGQVVRDTAGNPFKLFGVSHDITEYQQSQEALHAKTLLLESLAETSMDGILAVDEQDQIIFYNQNFAEIWQIPPELLENEKGEKLLEYVLPLLVSPEQFVKEIEFLYANKKEKRKSEIALKDGRTLERFSSPLMDANGVQHGRIWFYRDITERKLDEIALKESELKYRNIFENIQDVFYETTIEGTLLDVSPSIEQISKGQYKRKDLIGKPLTGIYADPRERQLFLEQIQHQGSVSDYEVTLKNRDGTQVYCSISSKLLYDPGGKPQKIIGTMRDITERRKAEQALQERESYLRTILHTTAEGFLVVNTMNGRIIEGNEAYCRMSGYDRNTLVKLRLKDIEAVETPEETVGRIQRVIKKGSELFETLHRRKDGSLLPVEVSVTHLKKDGGQFVCFCRDLTERKQKEERIILFSRMLDAAPASITIHDTDGNFLFANQATLALHGYDNLEDYLAINLHDRDVPESEALLKERFRQIAEEGKAQFEVEHYRKDGSTFPLEVTAKKIDWHGRPAVLSIAIDVTERKAAETQLREKTNLLQNITNHMFDMVAITDLAGVFTYAGPSHRILGYEPAQLIGTSVFDYVHPDDAEYITKEFKEFTAHPSPDTARTVEYRNRCKDGSYFWLETKGKILFENNGSPCSLFFSSRDITERKAAEQALQKNEQLLKKAEELNRSGAWELDLVENFSTISENWQRILGIQNPLMDWEEFQTLIHPDDQEKVKETFKQALAGIKPYEIEHRIIRKPDGECLHIHCRGEVVRDSSGRPLKMTGVSVDITHRKQVEEALRTAVEQQNAIFETSMVGIMLLHNRIITRVNQRMAEMLGYTPEELEGEGPQKLHLSHANYLEFGENFYWLLAEQTIVQVEFPLRHKDGHTVWCLFNGRAIEPPDLSRGAVWAIDDITDRKLAEQKLRESEERFRALLNDVQMVSVQGYAPDGTTLYWNKGSEQIYGYTQEEALGQNLLELIIPPEMKNDVKKEMQKMAETGEPVPSAELSLLRKDGSRVSVYSSHCILQRPGRPQELFCIDIDLTKIKRAEEEREKLREQLTQAQKMESVGRLAGGVAHDFNNMLNVILGHAGLVLEDISPDSPFKEGLNEIQKAAQRSADLTRQLLAFARRQTISPKVLNLNETIESLLKMLNRLIGEDIDLVWKPADKLDSIRIDPAQIDQVLANLVVNARDAISGVGKIMIETSQVEIEENYASAQPGFRPGDYVLLTISDDGQGMDEETKAKIFEPFFTTKKTGEGTGLGLATVYGIVQQNRGFLNVYSELGHGTTFKIYLPVYRPEKISAPSDKPVAKPVEKGHETILLVEDEPAILSLGDRMLKKLGYQVLAASTPTEAIRIAEEHPGQIDLLITDVVMPEMNGRDLAKRLLSLYPDLKRIFMSGYTADVIAHRGILEDGVNFIQKPFSPQLLGRKIREVLEK